MNYIPVAQSRKSRKHQGAASGTQVFICSIESLLYIAVWALLFYLWEDFITAVVCWQGYQLMVGNSLSLATINESFAVLEYVVYFGIAVFLVLLSWSEWNK